MTEAEKLYEMLRKAQEPKGFLFNKDKARVIELLEALLQNKQRYGYMCCPCRLASNNREQDKDIICPCACTDPKTLRNTEAVTAVFMSHLIGMMEKSLVNTYLRDGPWKNADSRPEFLLWNRQSGNVITGSKQDYGEHCCRLLLTHARASIAFMTDSSCCFIAPLLSL